MNPELMTQKLQEVFMNALSICQENSNPELSSEHMLKAFLKEEDITDVLKGMGCNINELKAVTDRYLERLSSTSTSEPTVNRYLFNSYNEALNNSKKRNDAYISIFEMFMAVVYNNSLVSEELRKHFNFKKEELEEKLFKQRGDSMIQNKEDENNLNPLKKYGRNLVEDVRNGKIDPVIGRDDEIRRVIEILSRKTKNNPVLIGEPGVGKTAIEEPQYELPINVYAYSKLSFDQYMRKQYSTHYNTVVGLRYFNVYGTREASKGKMASMVYQLAKQLMGTGTAKLFTGTDGYPDGGQERDFVCVEDVAKSNLFFADNPRPVKGIFNVGTGKARSFNDVANTLIKLNGSGKIEYVPFPEKLIGKYQSFTEANLDKLRAAGYADKFLTLEEGASKRWETWKKA